MAPAKWRVDIVWKGLIGLAIGCILILTLFAALPWGIFRSSAEQLLSNRLEREVTLGKIRRIDHFSLHPLVEISHVSILQPSWAGSGTLANLGPVKVQFSAISLLGGRFEIERLGLEDGVLNLKRDAGGRENWSTGGAQETDGEPYSPLRQLSVARLRIRYQDDKQSRSAVIEVSADPGRDLRFTGEGQIHGHQVDIAGKAALPDPQDSHRPSSFQASITGQAIGFNLQGTMDRPLDLRHFTAQVDAYGDDLALIDAIIEAGLPGTQAVRLHANVSRDGRNWKISALEGSIGRSHIAGGAVIAKQDTRTHITGSLRSKRLDFRDLASDAGLVKAAAKRAKFGERVIPDTAIDLETVANTDGVLDIEIEHLLWPGRSPFRTVSTRLQLERSRLQLRPFTAGLSHGRLEGIVDVDQRDGGPRLLLDLRMRDARLLDFFPEAKVDGSLQGKMLLTGNGKTLREGIGRSSGIVALIANDGVLPARTASLLGQDLGGGLFSGKAEQARLRCLVIRLPINKGIAIPDPVLIDTDRAVTRAHGTINLATENLSLALQGAPKQKASLRITGLIPVRGTIKAPVVSLPESNKSVSGIVKMIGRAIIGKTQAKASDLNCRALERDAMK